MSMEKKYEIAGIWIDNLFYNEILEKIDDLITNNNKGYIVTVNPEMILNAQCDNKFLDILKKAEIRTADGIGILWAVNYVYNPYPKSGIGKFATLLKSLFDILLNPKKTRSLLKERITGSDMLPKIINYSQNKNWRIFLLGASDGIAEIAKQNFLIKYPKAQFVGCYAGSPDSEFDKNICNYINKTKPDIIFVAYGSPKQEYWISRNLPNLHNVKLAIGVGGAFDFYAGKINRAPKLIQKIGLEWLWRLILEPKRIFRIWNATYVFIKFITKQKN